MEVRDNEVISNRSRLAASQAAVMEQQSRREPLARTESQATIPRQSVGSPLPLSLAQESLWLLDRLASGSALYNIAHALRLRGPLDVPALERSLNEILLRHTVLRARFPAVADRPSQVIASELRFSLRPHDLQSLPPEACEAERERWLKTEATRSFALETGPLVRAALLRTAPEDHTLALTLHHIVFDGWSLELFLGELTALYRSFVAGQASPLPELSIQHADFVRWQQEWLRSAACTAQLEFWRGALAGAPEMLALPGDHPRPSKPAFPGGSRERALPADLSQALRTLSAREGVSLFMTLLASFKVLLARYTGQTDIVVGAPVFNRGRVEFESLIGFLVNMVVLRTDTGGDPTFGEFLGRVVDTTLGALEHPDLPFERLVQELHPVRAAGHNPLFQVTFAFERLPAAVRDVAGLSLEASPVFTATSKFDLSLFVEERNGELAARVEYSTALFEAATIERLLGHYVTLLQGIVAAPERRIGELPLLTEAERRQVLEEWNRTQVAHPDGALLHQLVEAQADRTPDAVAVVCENASLTFRELDARGNQLARHLQSLGVGPDTLVGLSVERSLEMVVGLLGVLKAGGAYVPMDLAYPPDRIAFMIADTRMAVLLTGAKQRDELPASQARVVCLDEDWPIIAHQPATRPAAALTPEHLAYVIYTSGSTGRPKGVMIPHRAIVNHMHWMQRVYPLSPADAVLQKTPFSFDASVWEFYAPLMAGGRLIVARPEGHLDGPYLVETITRERVTTLQMVPSLLRMLLAERSFTRCVSLKRVFCGGEALATDLQNQFFATLPQATLHNLYGPTEAAIDSTAWDCVRGATGAAVPIGRPVDNATAFIVNARLQPVPIGVPGELLIGGKGLARGYLNQPELTAEKFITNPFGAGRVYRTGDQARWRADGVIEFLCRLDQQVKLRGHRIELGEIEATLRQHPAVADTVVVLQEGASSGARLIAYVVPRGVVSVPAELRAFLKTQLPGIMIPAAFIDLPRLPLLPNGKLDRRALPDAGGAWSTARSRVAPRTPVETVLTALWAQVLGRADFGVEDDFFELGGHSLLAARVGARIRQTWQVDLSLADFLNAPTVAAQAAGIEDALVAEVRGLTPAEIHKTLRRPSEPRR